MAESSGHQDVNRRQYPRFLCTGAVEISQQGSRWGWGRVNDISMVGCYIEIAQLLPIGTDAQLRLNIADKALEVAAKIVSNDPGIGMGMKFVSVTQEQLSMLTQIVGRLTETDSPASRKAELSRPGPAPIRITREVAPVILAKIVKRINETGVLTRQDLVDIVKAIG